MNFKNWGGIKVMDDMDYQIGELVKQLQNINKNLQELINVIRFGRQ